MTLEKIEAGRGGAHQPAVAIHHFTEEEIEERRCKALEVQEARRNARQALEAQRR